MGLFIIGGIMATSTIFANIVIKDTETAERFVTALEESEKECQLNKESNVKPYPFVRDLDEIRKIVSRRYNKK